MEKLVKYFAVALLVVGLSGVSGIGIMWMNTSTLDANMTDLQNEYESLLSSYEDQIDLYLGLNETYNSLLDDYAALMETLNILSTDYNELDALYNQLLLNYDTLSNNFDSLLIDYNNLLDEYNGLQVDYALLQTNYLNLYNNYQNLNESYWVLYENNQLLQSDYDALTLAYSILEGQYDYLKTTISQMILPAQYMIFAEAIRRYYFFSQYVNGGYDYHVYPDATIMEITNESLYYTGLARFCRDIVLHDSDQKIQDNQLLQVSDWLVVPPEDYDPDPWEDVINLDYYSWVRLDNIHKGDDIKITGTFTNNDTDFYAWWIGTDNTTWVLADDLFHWEAGTLWKPEVGSFIADRDGSIMIGIYDYSKEIGSWNIRINKQHGIFSEVSNLFSNIFSYYGADTEYMSKSIMRRYFTYTMDCIDSRVPRWGLNECPLYGSISGDWFGYLARMLFYCNARIDYEYDYRITSSYGELDYVKFSTETMFRTLGDDEDQAIILSSYLESCGYQTAIVQIHDNVNYIYRTGLMVQIEDAYLSDFYMNYPLTTVYTLWHNSEWETYAFVDMSERGNSFIPFSNNPSWIDYYITNYGDWSVVMNYWTVAFCDIDGLII